MFPSVIGGPCGCFCFTWSLLFPTRPRAWRRTSGGSRRAPAGRPICNKPPSRGSPVRACSLSSGGSDGVVIGGWAVAWASFDDLVAVLHKRDRTCPLALHGLIIPQWPKTRNQRLRRAPTRTAAAILWRLSGRTALFDSSTISGRNPKLWNGSLTNPTIGSASIQSRCSRRGPTACAPADRWLGATRRRPIRPRTIYRPPVPYTSAPS